MGEYDKKSGMGEYDKAFNGIYLLIIHLMIIIFMRCLDPSSRVLGFDMFCYVFQFAF